jgi:hypothetical protein
VVKAYEAGGIRLKDVAKALGLSERVTNVSYLYLLVKAKPEWVIALPNQIASDIVFFKNTYSRTPVPGDDGVSHAGIVVSTTGPATVSMIHAAGTRRCMKDEKGKCLCEIDSATGQCKKDASGKKIIKWILDESGKPKIYGVVRVDGIDLTTDSYWSRTPYADKDRFLGFGRPRNPQ